MWRLCHCAALYKLHDWEENENHLLLKFILETSSKACWKWMIKLKGHSLFYLENHNPLWEISVNRLQSFGFVQDSLTHWVAWKIDLIHLNSLLLKIRIIMACNTILGISQLIILMASVYCMITMCQTTC